jgi:hypothetical protein
MGILDRIEKKLIEKRNEQRNRELAEIKRKEDLKKQFKQALSDWDNAPQEVRNREIDNLKGLAESVCKVVAPGVYATFMDNKVSVESKLNSIESMRLDLKRKEAEIKQITDNVDNATKLIEAEKMRQEAERLRQEARKLEAQADVEEENARFTIDDLRRLKKNK